MTVGELINELKKYPEERRALLYAHGRCGTKEQDEIISCFEEEILDGDDNVAEYVVSLAEY